MQLKGICERYLRAHLVSAGIETIGKDRFKIVSIRQEKPVLVCDVELLDEEDDTTASAILLRPS